MCTRVAVSAQHLRPVPQVALPASPQIPNDSAGRAISLRPPGSPNASPGTSAPTTGDLPTPCSPRPSPNLHVFSKLHTLPLLAPFKRFITALFSATSESFAFREIITLVLSTTSAHLQKNTGVRVPAASHRPPQPSQTFTFARLNFYTLPRGTADVRTRQARRPISQRH
jgi:hypothetical protein